MSPVADHPNVVTHEGNVGLIESETAETHDGQLEVLVNFENGARLWVPADRLILQEDGNFLMTMSLEELSVQLTRPTVAARPSDLNELLAPAKPNAAAPTPAGVTQAAPAITAETPPQAQPAQTSPAEPAATPAPSGADDLEVPDFASEAADLPEPPPSDLDHVQVSRVVESIREDVGAPLLREEVEIHRVPVNEYVDTAPPIRYEDDRVIIPVLEEVLQVEKRLILREEVVITKRRGRVTGEQRHLRQVIEVVASPTTADPPNAPPGQDTTYRQHYEAQRHPGARGFAFYEPAYRFGQLLRTSSRYRDWTWDRLEPEARALWERDNPGTWTAVQPAVRYAWDSAPAGI